MMRYARLLGCVVLREKTMGVVFFWVFFPVLVFLEIRCGKDLERPPTRRCRMRRFAGWEGKAEDMRALVEQIITRYWLVS